LYVSQRESFFVVKIRLQKGQRSSQLLFSSIKLLLYGLCVLLNIYKNLVISKASALEALTIQSSGNQINNLRRISLDAFAKSKKFFDLWRALATTIEV
jgi:hypothetical protein